MNRSQSPKSKVQSPKRGSALVGAIWTLAVLSILIASYALDAHLQTRVNLYLAERMRVDHLTDAGIAIAEVIITDYQNVTVPNEDDTTEEDLEEKLEDDRWYEEKVALKDNRECDTGAIPIDALDADGGTVTVKIKPIETKWNINKLYPQGDANYLKVWMGILAVVGVPEDYWESIINSWVDWRDSDGDVTTGEEEQDNGAEDEYYAKAYEEFKDNEERPDSEEYRRYHNYRAKCRNGEIADLDELKCLKGFNEFDEKPIDASALLDGGVLNPEADEDDRVTIPAPGLRPYFSVFGSGKLNVNIADKDILATVPGFYQGEDPDRVDPEDVTNALALAEAAVSQRQSGESIIRKGKSSLSDDETGSYTDFNDLKTRVNDGVQDAADVGSVYLQDEASEYLTFQPDKYFEITITGASMGITHSVKATAIVQDSKVRYIRWQEDP